MTQWILTSSVLILLVLAVRGLFKEKMKAKYTYALWLIVLVRLLCPVNFGELSFNLLSLVEEHKEAQESILPQTETDMAWEEQKAYIKAHGIRYVDPENPTEIVSYPVDSSDEQKHIFSVEAIASEAESTQTLQLPEKSGFELPVINWQKVLPIVWAVGMVVLALVIVSVNVSFSTMLGLFRKELPVFSRKGHGSQTLPVYLADGIYSSCLYGVVRPSIYLNRKGMGEQEERYCIEHEYSHYLQGDMLWTVCRIVCLILHWYNPLVWLAVTLSRKDAELACDERTIERLGEEERYSYGHTLVELAAKQSQAMQMFGMATLMTSDKKEVVNRVKAITTKKQTKIITGLVVLCLLVGIGCFVFTGVAKGEQENNKTDAPVITVTPTETPEKNEEIVAADTAKNVEEKVTPTPLPAFIVEGNYRVSTYRSLLNDVLEKKEFPVQGLVIANRLNVRSGPGTDYDKLTILNKDTEVTILDVIEEDGKYWYMITCEAGSMTEGASAQTGYVMSSYIVWAGTFRVDENIREFLGITESEWDMVREKKKQEILLTLTEEVNYTPLSFADHVVLEQVPGEGWIVDFNGDGEAENLYINANGVYINGEKKFLLSNKQTFWLLDIDTTDKMYELLTSSGDMYIYDGTEFQRVKGITECYFSEENISTPTILKRYFGTLSEFVRVDEHTISFEDCFYGWVSFFATAEYTLDENHNLQVVPKEYTIQTVGQISTLISTDDQSFYSEEILAKKFKVYAERNLDGSYMEVNWLTDVKLLKSDCVEWIYAEMADGTSGWLHYDETAEDQFRVLVSD